MSALNDNPDLLSRPMRVGFMNTTRMAAPSSSGTKAERVRTFPCLISSRCDESADALTNGMDRSDATGSRGRPAHEARALEQKLATDAQPPYRERQVTSASEIDDSETLQCINFHAQRQRALNKMPQVRKDDWKTKWNFVTAYGERQLGPTHKERID